MKTSNHEANRFKRSRRACVPIHDIKESCKKSVFKNILQKPTLPPVPLGTEASKGQDERVAVDVNSRLRLEGVEDPPAILFSLPAFSPISGAGNNTSIIAGGGKRLHDGHRNQHLPQAGGYLAGNDDDDSFLGGT